MLYLIYCDTICTRLFSVNEMKVFTMLKKKDYPEKGYRRSNKLHCILGLDLETLKNFPIFINMYPVQENT